MIGDGEDTTSKEELWEMSWSWRYFAVFDQDGESSMDEWMDVMSCHVMMDIVKFQLPGCEQGGQISAYYVFKGVFYDEMN